MTKKKKFLKSFDENYEGVFVEMKIPDCPEPEIIWNPKENFAVKREYYAKTYNKKLEMIVKPEIKIVRWTFE